MAQRTTDISLKRSDLAVLIAMTALLATAILAGSSARPLPHARLPVLNERVSAAREQVDPNQACEASLLRLPGIGPTRAQAIIHYRTQHGGSPFRTADDLDKINGIGPGIVKRLRPHMKLPPQ